MAIWNSKQNELEQDLTSARFGKQDQERSSEAAYPSPALPKDVQTGGGDSAASQTATAETQVDTANSPAAALAAYFRSRELREGRLNALASGAVEHRFSRNLTEDFDAARREEAEIDRGRGDAQFEVAATSGPLVNTVDVVSPPEDLVEEAVRMLDETEARASIEGGYELSHVVPTTVLDSGDREAFRDGRLSGDMPAHEACHSVESIMSDAVYNIAEVCDRVVAAESSVTARISELLEEIGELDQQREKLKVIQSALLPLLVPVS